MDFALPGRNNWHTTLLGNGSIIIPGKRERGNFFASTMKMKRAKFKKVVGPSHGEIEFGHYLKDPDHEGFDAVH